jgi:hypothetical protein
VDAIVTTVLADTPPLASTSAAFACAQIITGTPIAQPNPNALAHQAERIHRRRLAR